jgi:NADPH:quinone reductase-like Zn-dependent oxidoreductase
MRAVVCPKAPIPPSGTKNKSYQVAIANFRVGLRYVTNHPRPQTEHGRVLVRIRAAGLNRSELFTRQGHSPSVKFPRVLGIEAVGEVVDNGGDSTWKQGDKVAAVMGDMGRAFDGISTHFIISNCELC